MEAGQRIGRYLLTKKIGKGGMAEIFKAEEEVSGGHRRVVAIKRLFPKLSADREFVGMFVNEARIASSMFHPNIVQTYDLINYGSYYYIVMEYLEGLDLEEFVLMKGPGGLVLPLDEAAYVVHEVAMGLSYAHKGGARPADGAVVHRDISPGNILLDVDGLVKVTDFGIARAMQYASFTKPGVLKGKYEYMSPEYVKGKNFDGRADLFSLGVVLYELLTGENPFAAVMPKEIWEKIVKYDPPKPSKISSEVPKALDVVVARALSKDPEKRYRTGEEMAAVLVSFFSDVGRDRVAGALGARVAHRGGDGRGAGVVLLRRGPRPGGRGPGGQGGPADGEGRSDRHQPLGHKGLSPAAGQHGGRAHPGDPPGHPA
jgi:serine/threonine-protein kinase